MHFGAYEEGLWTSDRKFMTNDLTEIVLMTLSFHNDFI